MNPEELDINTLQNVVDNGFSSLSLKQQVWFHESLERFIEEANCYKHKKVQHAVNLLHDVVDARETYQEGDLESEVEGEVPALYSYTSRTLILESLKNDLEDWNEETEKFSEGNETPKGELASEAPEA